MDELLGIILLTIKGPQGIIMLLTNMGYPSVSLVSTLLGDKRSYRCGKSNIPFKYAATSVKINYGDNGNGGSDAKIALSHYDCLILFHPVETELTTSQRADLFLQSMSDFFKTNLMQNLVSISFIKSVNSASKSKDLDSAFDKIDESEKKSIYNDQVNFLTEIRISKEIRISNSASSTKVTKTTTNTTKSPKSTLPLLANSDTTLATPKGTGKRGKEEGKRQPTIGSLVIPKLEASNIDTFTTTNSKTEAISEDLSARHWRCYHQQWCY